MLIYAPALSTWFQDDDFAFLSVLPVIRAGGHPLTTLLEPSPAGGWRPLSDRFYYFLLESSFGPNPLPFHIISFLTQFTNLALIAAITRRLTGSALAAFLAPAFWIIDSKQIVVMTWCLAYDYILCGLCLLTAFWLFLRWLDTSRRLYSVMMWTVFLLGFGVLETNVVFPILAASYALLCARAHFRKTLPLFFPSIVFVALHLALIHPAATGPYRMHLTAGMLKTFGRYWAWAFAPDNLDAFAHLPQAVASVGMVLLTLALVTFTGYRAVHRDTTPSFFLSWFAIVLLPALPLRDNMQDLYLVLPSIGIAMLGGYAFYSAWKSPIAYKLAGAGLVGLYVLESVPSAHGGADWYRHRSLEVQEFVQSVEKEHLDHPNKPILVAGMDQPLFEASMRHHPFLVFGVPDVFLAPGAEAAISPGDPAGIFEFAAPPVAMSNAVTLELRNGKWSEVANYSPPPVAAETATNRQRLDVADPRTQNQLGPEWYALDQGFRWMPKRATVRLPGPVSDGQKLIVSGYCPAVQVASAPLRMVVSVDGTPLPAVRIDKPDAPFSFEFPLRANARPQIEVAVEVDRTFSTPQDRRTLGLAFGVFELR